MLPECGAESFVGFGFFAFWIFQRREERQEQDQVRHQVISPDHAIDLSAGGREAVQEPPGEDLPRAGLWLRELSRHGGEMVGKELDQDAVWNRLQLGSGLPLGSV